MRPEIIVYNLNLQAEIYRLIVITRFYYTTAQNHKHRKKNHVLIELISIVTSKKL